MRGLPRELSQISRSDVSAQNVTGGSAARYFDYASALALRNLAAHYGTAMPRYLLAPEVALLLDAERDQRKRLLIETFCNTGGRLKEVLPLTPEDFALDDRDGRAPFAVLHALKQRRDEDRQKQRGSGQSAPRRPAHRSGLRAPAARVSGHCQAEKGQR